MQNTLGDLNNHLKAEQQQMKLEDRKQIKFNFEKEKK